jgi:hypothetical protein
MSPEVSTCLARPYHTKTADFLKLFGNEYSTKNQWYLFSVNLMFFRKNCIN